MIRLLTHEEEELTSCLTDLLDRLNNDVFTDAWEKEDELEEIYVRMNILEALLQKSKNRLEEES